ncbi:hypothetical protein DUI87_13864 [Hirundo rustica rustica]|uniref:Uncharacterized protein n=1 Tax=Hirundo rustica rustica TaxID=333673 RepID=A0A3M0KCQ1_HIRRU|nr:hypothetical protein DUI87_13864 [Hirundo rustica rustica]
MYTFLHILGKSFLLQLIEISTCIAVVRPQLQSCPSLSQHSKDLELLERAQRRHQDEQRDGAALLGGKAGRAGIVQPGQEKLWGELSVALQGLEELQERWRETIAKGWRDRTQGMAPTARGQGWMGSWAGIVPWQGVEALAQGAQSSCGCPWIPGSAQGQVNNPSSASLSSQQSCSIPLLTLVPPLGSGQQLQVLAVLAQDWNNSSGNAILMNSVPGGVNGVNDKVKRAQLVTPDSGVTAAHRINQQINAQAQLSL